ncbi:hypothetical protein N9U66_00335 [Synechococcus sp. AH-736-M20]|nr:hypothetical protein [Synechococcus sp. AH-736-M20]
MHSIYLPLHIWDREFESRLVIACIEAWKGNIAIIGHEYNISKLYERDNNALLFRAGGPLNHSIRGRWHNLITSNGGIVITQDEEGINNLPLIFCREFKKLRVKLDLKKISEYPQTANLQAFKDVSLELAWSNLHRAYLSHQIKQIECRAYAVNNILDASSTRFDLLGDLGLIIQERTINSIHSLFGNYILVLDNFSVNLRGQKAIIDPTNDLRQAGWSDEEIKKHIDRIEKNRSIESKAREDFSQIIKNLAREQPDINFIFRPHPVLDPSFWHQQFSGYKNISIIEKGSIHAWIYGSTATIHSGCTTGLEAYGAGKETLDISSLISHRTDSIKTSLIGQSARKLDSYRELKSFIKQLWIQSGQENLTYSTINSIRQEYQACHSENPINNALNIIKRNSSKVANNIRGQLNLSNAEDVFGSNSAIAEISKASDKLNSQNKKKYNENILSKPIGNMLPNLGKSRYVSEQEVRNKLADICLTFDKLGMKVPPVGIRQIGINSFAILRDH